MKPIRIDNKKELLEQIRDNNCREILLCEVNIRTAERQKSKYPARMGEIEKFITEQKLKLEGLMDGVHTIDDKLDEL